MTPYRDTGASEKRTEYALKIYNNLTENERKAMKKTVESFRARFKSKGMKYIPGFESTLDLFMALGTFCNEHDIKGMG